MTSVKKKESIESLSTFSCSSPEIPNSPPPSPIDKYEDIDYDYFNDEFNSEYKARKLFYENLLNETRKIAIIRNFYHIDDEKFNDIAENDLEKAFELNYEMIIIELEYLGEEIARFIKVGKTINCTLKVTSCSSIITAYLYEDKPFIYCTTAALSVICVGLYTCLWINDPCCNYSVDKNAMKTLNENKTKLIENSIPFKSTILVKHKYFRFNKHAHILNTAISLIALAISTWKLCKLIRYM